MKGEGYSTFPSKDFTAYYFESIGVKGRIPKVIVFLHLEKGIWNMGFGDGDSLDFDDEVISNNHDVLRILQTIANTVHQFLEVYPDSSVLIRPVDDKRQHLYNAVFRRKMDEISTFFMVLGLVNGSFKPYNPTESYVGFLVSRKSY